MIHNKDLKEHYYFGVTLTYLDEYNYAKINYNKLYELTENKNVLLVCIFLYVIVEEIKKK